MMAKELSLRGGATMGVAILLYVASCGPFVAVAMHTASTENRSGRWQALDAIYAPITLAGDKCRPLRGAIVRYQLFWSAIFPFKARVPNVKVDGK
jgi:hypothetical protein